MGTQLPECSGSERAPSNTGTYSNPPHKRAPLVRTLPGSTGGPETSPRVRLRAPPQIVFWRAPPLESAFDPFAGPPPGSPGVFFAFASALHWFGAQLLYLYLAHGQSPYQHTQTRGWGCFWFAGEPSKTIQNRWFWGDFPWWGAFQNPQQPLILEGKRELKPLEPLVFEDFP
jgi:hypothetical protein